MVEREELDEEDRPPLRGSLETEAEIQSALVGGNATLRNSAN
jgi:hypothetical protein